MQSLYTIEQARELDAQFITQLSTDDLRLMQRAGRALWLVLQQQWPAAKDIIIVIGGGNNGGDGFVCATLAHEAGLNVEVLMLQSIDQLSGDASTAAQACVAAGVACSPFDESKLLDAQVIVDALLGIGVTETVRDDYQAAIDAINNANALVLSVDVPSGLHADTGVELGRAVKADVTVTMIGYKRGLVTGAGHECCGKLICHDLGLSKTPITSASNAQLVSVDDYPLPKRDGNAHKGSYGHVLVIGGNKGMVGAVCMAAQSASRIGAGLVSVITQVDHVGMLLNAQPELMVHTIDDIDDLLDKCSVIAIGPGLGKDKWANTLLNAILQSDKPKVIDADALNLLESQQRDDWILTPHPGEAARLLGCDNDAINNDRYAASARLQQRFGGVAVLKGAGTIVTDEQQQQTVCAHGNPGMASGGMGDVLTGVIAGLLAQGLSPSDAANAGVCLHAAAADRIAQEHGERGLLSTDLSRVLS